MLLASVALVFSTTEIDIGYCLFAQVTEIQTPENEWYVVEINVVRIYFGFEHQLKM